MKAPVIFFVAAVSVMGYSAIASCMLGKGLDFKEDATNVNVRLSVVASSGELGFGDVDLQGYLGFLGRISRMEQLRELSIIILDSPIGGLTFPADTLEGLTNLCSLEIWNCGTNPVKLTSIGKWKKLPIRNLVLKYLDIEGTDQTCSFPNLESLYCTSEKVLANAPDTLFTLRVEAMETQGRLSFSRFRRLTVLHLCDVKCHGIDGIEALKNLESLSLHDAGLLELSCVRACAKLKCLEISSCGRLVGNVNLACLGRLPLESMELEDLRLEEIRGLEKCPLVDLVVKGGEIGSLNGICDLPKLERLDVSETSIHVIERDFIKKRFPNLKRLCYTDIDLNCVCVEW